MPQGWLTLVQAAERLDVDTSTFRWWFKRHVVETVPQEDGTILYRLKNGLIAVKHSYPAQGWWEIDPNSLEGVQKGNGGHPKTVDEHQDS